MELVSTSSFSWGEIASKVIRSFPDAGDIHSGDQITRHEMMRGDPTWAEPLWCIRCSTFNLCHHISFHKDPVRWSTRAGGVSLPFPEWVCSRVRTWNHFCLSPKLFSQWSILNIWNLLGITWLKCWILLKGLFHSFGVGDRNAAWLRTWSPKSECGSEPGPASCMADIDKLVQLLEQKCFYYKNGRNYSQVPGINKYYLLFAFIPRLVVYCFWRDIYENQCWPC